MKLLMTQKTNYNYMVAAARCIEYMYLYKSFVVHNFCVVHNATARALYAISSFLR